MTFQEFKMSVLKSQKPKSQRFGQWAVNYLHTVRPDLGNQMTSDKPYDPFYDDDRLPEFWRWVEENW